MTIFFWWACYSIVATYAQFFFINYDFFTPGLILCLQFRKWRLALGLVFLWTILGEGGNRLIFGSVLLFYAGVIAFFFIGSWFLEEKNAVFVFLLASLTAGWQWAVSKIMANLQEINLPYELQTLVIQSLITFCLWLICFPVYRRFINGKD